MTTAEFFATRAAALGAGVLAQLADGEPHTASELQKALRAGMRELDRVLQSLRQAGRIQSRRRRWEIVK